MTGSSWACAALLYLHLSSLGALPKEVTADQVRPYAAGERPMRVLVASGVSSLHLRPQMDVAIEGAEGGARLAVVSSGAKLTLTPSGDRVRLTGPGLHLTKNSLRIAPVGDDLGTVLSVRGGWGRRGVYPGVLHIVSAPGGLRVVEHVDLETYAAGVVASEMPSYFPPEALKAQAIAARTYALCHLGGHTAEGADICARVHCQAYGGVPSRGAPALAAARETAGQILSWKGVVVDALYHAACGGSTAPAWEVRQGKLLPYLCGGPDKPDAGDVEAPYCSVDHKIRWTVRLPWEKTETLLKANLGTVLSQPGLSPGRLDGLRLMRNTATGRAQWLKVYTDTGTYRVRGDDVRWVFGTGRPGAKGLRSSAFEMTAEREPGSRPDAFVFDGVGHGHGIGLCQWGARGRALSGQNASEILGAYYPGATVVDLARE